MVPGYNIPSRVTITTRLEARYKNKKAELKTQLAAANVALMTDCWTALTTESYITVNCHYIENDWQVKSAVLLTESFSERHAADNLADKLNQAVESWGLTGRVIACVHDNVWNIVSANNPTRQLENSFVLCTYFKSGPQRWIHCCWCQLSNCSCWQVGETLPPQLSSNESARSKTKTNATTSSSAHSVLQNQVELCM